MVIIVALLIASLYVWTLYKTMNNVANQRQANVYIVQDSFAVHNKKDKFLYSNVTKVARPRDNDRGGSRSGGGSRGGGPRGGGGGPRGGGPRGGGRR